MTRAIDAISDAEMLACFDGPVKVRKLPTYVIRNTLRSREITSRHVRERLLRMERDGLIERLEWRGPGYDYEWQPVRQPEAEDQP